MTLRAAVVVALLLGTPIASVAQAPLLVPKLERLASAGNAEALYHLGMMYQTGSGVTLDYRKALAYFRRAAALGDPLAYFKLGCFDLGQNGVLPIDEDKALAETLVAAQAGYALAQQDVAAIYARRGDAPAADAWLAKAAGQGIADALFGYASLHNGTNGLPRDGAIVAAYFTMFLAVRTATTEQTSWLAEQRTALSVADRARADRIVSDFTPRPTSLTLKALSGLRAAETLVATTK